MLMRWMSVLVCCLALLASAAGAEAAERRIALVVGNSGYVHTTALANPRNDARDVSAALKDIGFEVVEALDADKSKLDAAMRSFTDRLTGADIALFFYAGHGLQVGAQNYLVPTDARLERERDLEFEAVRLDFVLRQMEIDREGKTSIVILDACRDNPLARNLARSMGTRSVSIGRGLAAAATGLGTFIAFATQPGNVALDGQGRNSPFTAALTRHMRVKGRNLNATMIEVRKEVVSATDGKQVPWDHSALTGEFFFVPGDEVPRQGSVAAAPAGSSSDLAALQERLAKLEAEAKARDVSPAASAGAGAMMTADGIKLAELRARAASLDDLVKDLQKKLFAARREEGNSSDPNEKSKLQRKSIDIQMEWTRRGLDLKKLREEIAALEGKAAPASPGGANDLPNESQVAAAANDVPPVVAKPRLEKESPNFETTENVRLEGAIIRSSKAPSPAACRDACERDTACAAYQHGRRIPVMGQCELFSKIDSRHEDDKWRSGVRRGIPAANGKSFTSGSSEWKRTRAFTIMDKHRSDGELIRKLAVATPKECLDACEQERRCDAFHLAEKGAAAGTCKLIADPQSEIADDNWTTGLKDTPPARVTLPTRTSHNLGFDFHDATLVFGETIKEANTDSADGCMTVCRNTPSCVAAAFGTELLVGTKNCRVLAWIKGSIPSSTSTAIVRAK